MVETLLCGVAATVLSLAPGEIQPKGHYAMEIVPLEAPRIEAEIDFAGSGDKIGGGYVLHQQGGDVAGTLRYAGDLGDASYCFIRSDEFGDDEVRLAFSLDGASFTGKYYIEGELGGSASGSRTP